MKSMTCSQLGGACGLAFTGSSFDELAAQSQQHGREMFASGDEAHKTAMQEMMKIMESGQMDAWMQARREEFDAL